MGLFHLKKIAKSYTQWRATRLDSQLEAAMRLLRRYFQKLP